MKKYVLLIFVTIAIAFGAFAQNSENAKQLYNPVDDAKTEIANAIKKAKNEGKHVLLQLGGNWCSWCKMFDKKVTSNDTLRVAMKKNYIIYHVNYSKENKNEEVMASLGYPQRFGFPVFVILDGDGNRLHIQNSAYLEEGKGHSAKKVLEFFKHWSPNAIDAKHYEEQ